MKGNVMRMKFILAISSMALLSACGGGGDNAGKSGLSNIDKEWRAGFVESCTSSAVATGVPADVSAKACGCSADKMIEQYSLAERDQLDDGGTEEGMNILVQCVEELGLDQE